MTPRSVFLALSPRGWRDEERRGSTKWGPKKRGAVTWRRRWCATGLIGQKWDCRDYLGRQDEVGLVGMGLQVEAKRERERDKNRIGRELLVTDSKHVCDKVLVKLALKT